MNQSSRESESTAVAILLAVYNGAAYLGSQLESLLQQSGVNVRVVVSLDPSTDGSGELVRERMCTDSRIELLPMMGPSGGAAQNFFRLLRDAQFDDADFVCFSDQDDIWLPDRLIKAVSTLRATGADAYSSDVLAFWPDGREQVIRKSQPQRVWDHWFEAAGPGCTYVLGRSVALSLQGLVRSRWGQLQGIALHDWFCYAFARHHGFRWTIDTYPGVRYRQHGGNEMGANAGWRSFFKRAQMIRQGWLLRQSWLIAGALNARTEGVVARWSGCGRWGLLWLAVNAAQFRRRRRDQWLFCMACCYMFVVGWKPS